MSGELVHNLNVKCGVVGECSEVDESEREGRVRVKASVNAMVTVRVSEGGCVSNLSVEAAFAVGEGERVSG